MTTSHFAKLLGPAMLAACLLTGCFSSTPLKPEGPYVKTLHDGETVAHAAPYGEFTILSIDYSSGGGSFMTSGVNSYMRLIFRDKIAFEKARAIEPWLGLDKPAFFVEDSFGEWAEYLVYEAAGKPVVERIEAGNMYHSGRRRVYAQGFPFGYPWRQGVRYFPRAETPGGLFSVFPAKTQELPQPVDLRKRLDAYTLAAISPDETSFAYVDSMEEPTFVLVVDANGERRDPIPFPRVQLPPRPGPAINPYERVWSWFNATYAWQRDSNGKWSAKAVAPAARAAANPLEEIFLSDRTGYRSCFTAADAYCLTTWHQASSAEVAKEEPGDAEQPLVYAPSIPAQAFGANAKLLIYQRSFWSNSGYLLYTDATPALVAAEYMKRLEQRKIPFVRSDQCPKSNDGRADCEAQLKSRLNITRKYDDWLIRKLRYAAPGVTVFVLPDLVISLSASAQGSTVIQTVYRGDLLRAE